MAMRAVFGSMRLTKDIDFDRDPTLSQDSLKKSLLKSMTRAATLAGLRGARAQITKDTRTTVRARLEGGTLAGAEARFEIEVSGRSTPGGELVRTEVVVPPPQYSMAPFQVTTYTNEALAAMKIAAAMADQRTVARDLYDLHDLALSGANPVPILARQDPALLHEYATKALGKLELVTAAQMAQELAPYVPPQQRALLTEDAWIETTLFVADRIKGWCEQALAVSEAQDDTESEPQRGPAP